MIADLSIPVSSMIYMESLRIPILSKIASFFSPTKIYNDIAIKSVGLKDLIILKEIKIDGDFDIKNINKLHSLLLYAQSYVISFNHKNSVAVHRSIQIAIESLQEIKKIAEDYQRYEDMKNDLFEISSGAIMSNIEKYK